MQPCLKEQSNGYAKSSVGFLFCPSNVLFCLSESSLSKICENMKVYIGAYLWFRKKCTKHAKKGLRKIDPCSLAWRNRVRDMQSLQLIFCFAQVIFSFAWVSLLLLTSLLLEWNSPKRLFIFQVVWR